jgi:hypothetical protein
MLLVPAPAVTHPFVMLHAYLAPVPALATDAVLPDDLAHTEVVAVILAIGYADIVIVLLPELALQPVAFVTVTDIATEPDEPAV